jgi:hypothetical protein
MAAGRWLVALVFLAADASLAATVTQGDLGGGLGVTYTWQIALSGPGDSAEVVRAVGSKAWADPSNPGLGSFGLNAGWTHTSNWVYVNLAEAAEVEFSLAPNDAVSNGEGGFFAGDLVPAFSLWSGVDDDGTDDHYYEQGAVPHWIDAAGFAFLDHADEGPGPFDGSIATLTIELPAGEYTLALGGHDDTTLGHLAGYTFEVVAAPEPGGAVQLAAALAMLAGLARLRPRH